MSDIAPTQNPYRFRGPVPIILAAAMVTACGDSQHTATADVPESPFTIRVVLRASHPFLAEYDRSFTVEKKDGSFSTRCNSFLTLADMRWSTAG